MLLLVTGASGAGKSTARRAVAPALAPEVECVELGDIVPVPAAPTIAWRQQATELVVQYALQDQRRHLMLCGDPVAAGELIAAPSAARLDAIAVCLLDLDPAAQTARLTQRGDDPALLHHHHAFAEWMRGHARDPGHMPHVLSTNGWPPMRWDRLDTVKPWAIEVLDTSALGPGETADEVLAWCRRALVGEALILRVLE